MRLLWKRHGEDLSGYSFNDYQRATEDVYGEPLQTYFYEIILGTTPYETYLAPLLNAFGFNFELTQAEKFEEDKLGFRLAENRVDLIASDSPAEQCLCLNDLVLNVNNEKFEGNIKSGDNLSLEVLRMGKKKTIALNADGNHYFQIYQLNLKEDRNSEQTELLKGWFEDCIQ